MTVDVQIHVDEETLCNRIRDAIQRDIKVAAERVREKLAGLKNVDLDDDDRRILFGNGDTPKPLGTIVVKQGPLSDRPQTSTLYAALNRRPERVAHLRVSRELLEQCVAKDVVDDLCVWQVDEPLEKKEREFRTVAEGLRLPAGTIVHGAGQQMYFPNHFVLTISHPGLRVVGENEPTPLVDAWFKRNGSRAIFEKWQYV